MFPMDILEKGLAAQNFGMLGLGDIVVPGLFIALLCRFDYQWVIGCTGKWFDCIVAFVSDLIPFVHFGPE